MTDAKHIPHCREAPAALASSPRALRRLSPAGLWIRLVRPATTDTLATLALVLLNGLPGLVVALTQDLGRHV